MDTRLVDRQEIADAGLDDWRPILGSLRTRYRTGGFVNGLRLLNAIAAAAEAAEHHPDLDLRYGHLNIRMWSHDAGGITSRDLSLARTISDLAVEHGATAEPRTVSAFELALDTPDAERIGAFWQAVLGYDAPDGDGQLTDSDGQSPTMWFQRTEADEPRQRFHVDVYVPADERQARVAAVVAAGGTVVSELPEWTVLMDADGNRACICE